MPNQPSSSDQIHGLLRSLSVEVLERLIEGLRPRPEAESETPHEPPPTVRAESASDAPIPALLPSDWPGRLTELVRNPQYLEVGWRKRLLDDVLAFVDGCVTAAGEQLPSSTDWRRSLREEFERDDTYSWQVSLRLRVENLVGSWLEPESYAYRLHVLANVPRSETHDGDGDGDVDALSERCD